MRHEQWEEKMSCGLKMSEWTTKSNDVNEHKPTDTNHTMTAEDDPQK